MKKSSFLALFFFLLQAVSGQTDGMLWKISGKGITKPSYLFGTIHIHCNPESINKKVVRNAIKSCDTVAFEIDLGNISALIAKFYSKKHDSVVYFKLNLTPQEYKTVDSACKVLLNDSLSNLDPADPQELLFRIMYSKNFIGCDPFPIDLKLLMMVNKIHKPVMGLESIEFQDSLINTSSRKERLRNLVIYCMNLTKEKEKLKDMLAAYDSHKSMNICQSICADSILLGSAVLVRNINWFNLIKPRLEYNSYFIAVGAGHFCGEQGLIALLRKEGYTLTPINF